MYRSDKLFMKNPATAPMRIYIGNLADTVVPENLEERFKEHGHILGMHAQKGFAFIQYETADQAKVAIDREHGTQLHNRKINVKHANVDKRPGMGQSAAGDQRGSNPRGSFGEPINRSSNDPPSLFSVGGGPDLQGSNRGGMGDPNQKQDQGPNNQGGPMGGGSNQGSIGGSNNPGPIGGLNKQCSPSMGRNMNEGGPNTGRNMNEGGPNMGRNMNEGGPNMGRNMNEGGSNMGRNMNEGGPNMGRNTNEAGPNIGRNIKEVGPNMGRNMNDGGPNMGRNMNEGGPNTGRTINEGGPNMGRNMTDGGPNMGRNMNEGGPNTGRIMNEGGPNMGRNINEGGPNMGRNMNEGGPNTGRNMNEGGPNMGRNMNEGGPNMGRNMNEGGPNMGRNTNEGGPNMGRNTNEGGPNMGRNMNEGGPNMGRNMNEGGPNMGRNTNEGGPNMGRNMNEGGPNMGRNMNEGGPNMGRGPMSDGPGGQGGRMGDRDQQGGSGNRQGGPGPDRGNRGDWGNQRGDDRDDGDSYDNRNKFGGGGRNRGRGGRGKPYNSRDRGGGRDNYGRDDRDDNQFGSRSGPNKPDLNRGPPGGGARGGLMGGPMGGPMRGPGGPMGGGPRGNMPMGGDGPMGGPMDSPRFVKPLMGEKLPGPPDRPERNDCEIIVVSKQLTMYAEYVEQRLKTLGLVVDLLFPNEDVPIGRVLANISSRGCLFAILVMPQNEENRSLTLNILHGIPQEHRNMPLDDSLILITRNFDAYMRGEVLQATDDEDTKKLTDRHPDPLQTVFNLLAENRQLSSGQYDRVIKYLEERKELQMQFELTEGIESEMAEPEVKNKRAELQSRIMNILNKSDDVAPNIINPLKSDTLTAATATPSSGSSTATSGPTPLLNDPSVQKALDNILMGDMFKGLTGSI